MKSAKYSMEYCFRSPWISNKFNNDSSHNWILAKLSDHITIPISYRWSLSKNWETDPFWVHVDGLCNINLTIWTYWDTLNGLLSFSWIFLLRKEKKNGYPLYKDFIHIFEVVYMKKTRIVIIKQRGTSFCHLSLIKIKRKQLLLSENFIKKWPTLCRWS